MKILFDCSGGDKAPKSIIEGACMAKEKLDIVPYYVGDRTSLINYVPEDEYINIIDAKEVIENTEDPALAIRRKTNSSIVVALKELASGDYDGFVSAGSTGALLAGGLFILKRIPGVERAALPILLPRGNSYTMILDVGANMDTSPSLLANFAKMGSLYLENIFSLEKPKVALLNVGEEKGKGDKRSQETYGLLESSSLNFIGNIESREVFSDKADLIVTDGFSGNIMLKTMEGVVAYIYSLLQEGLKREGMDVEVKENITKLLFSTLSKLDYRKFGGVPLLGLQKPLIKAHGSSDSLAIYHATKVVKEMVDNKVIDKIYTMED